MASYNHGYNPSSDAGGVGRYYLSPVASFRSSSLRYLSADTLSAPGISSSLYYKPENYSIKVSGVYDTSTTSSFTSTGVDFGSTVATTDSVYAGLKRFYFDSHYQSGIRDTSGQTEGWNLTNLLAKRLKYERTTHLPTFPQRPGEKDCAHYMRTKTCIFGERCKFDHPFLVPEGGIPDSKETISVPIESLPERPGEPDCPYFLKTQRCKFGIRCKFNHPKDIITNQGATGNIDVSVLPERPLEPSCAFYMKTGNCKFGTICKFHHPKGVQVLSVGEENGSVVRHRVPGDAKSLQPIYTPTSLHNTKGFPIRQDEEDCPFYLKTGSCKYGATCRYNHPERKILTSPSSHFDLGSRPLAASLQTTFDSGLTNTAFGLGSSNYPQRPGQLECDYYMKNGTCKFGENCKFDHPIDRSVSKFTLAGLPRRECSMHCPYYMKTGGCKYGASCRFDHPPHGEVMTMGANTEAATSLAEQKENIVI